MQNPDKLIFVGFISSCFGIKGEIIINSLTVPVTNICELPLFDDCGKKIDIKLVKRNSKGDLICRINNITDRNEAELLVKTRLFCKRSSLPEIVGDEYYVEDLKGINVVDNMGKHIGKIENIFNFGAGDILEIKFTNNKIEMFPFTKEYFSKISVQYVVFNYLSN
ncbi:MAG: ribosome maturation factor RimM [Janthinobacterium lividum]